MTARMRTEATTSPLLPCRPEAQRSLAPPPGPLAGNTARCCITLPVPPILLLPHPKCPCHMSMPSTAHGEVILPVLQYLRDVQCHGTDRGHTSRQPQSGVRPWARDPGPLLSEGQRINNSPQGCLKTQEEGPCPAPVNHYHF